MTGVRTKRSAEPNRARTGREPGTPIRVLVVDDSALIRQLMTKVLSADPDIEVVGIAPNPRIAREKIKKLDPDVITLDVEMPELDGISFLERIMRLRPTPVVMVSALTQKGADVTLQALELGAIDVIAKPTLDIAARWPGIAEEIIGKVKAAAHSTVRPVGAEVRSVRQKSTELGFKGSHRIVAIGASTGGVPALQQILRALPADGPPVVIVQHLPTSFVPRFAERLNSLCEISVSVAVEGQRLMPGHAFVAPGDRHLTLKRSGAQFHCALTDAPPRNNHVPSVDVLFESVAVTAGENAVGIILTGMGKDGAEGLVEMLRHGAITLGQDEATSMIYGMPKVANELGAVEQELPLGKIAGRLLEISRGKR